MMEQHWKIITPSPFPHERQALDFIRAGLPDHDPYRAWANFEFQANDGALYEVDLLVLTREGFWLVEIKSPPGRLEGDAGTWTWTTPEGRRLTDDNPLSLANRKAKALKNLLITRPGVSGVRVPFLEAVIFLSSPDLDCQLTPAGMNRVCLLDRGEDHPQGPRDGILAGLLQRKIPGVPPVCRTEIDTKVARAISRAMDQAGIRRSQKERRAGDYFLGELLADGPGYQDRVATHAAITGLKRRARQYLVAQAANEDQRPRIQRAAEREFRLLQSLDHPNILRVHDFKIHDFGPILLFEHSDKAVRLDHYLTERAEHLHLGLRLHLLRQLVDAIRHAHGRRIIHRALSPQSVLVFDPDSLAPTVKVFNWQIGVRDSDSASTGTTHVSDLVDTQSQVYLAPEALFSPGQITPAADLFSLGAIAFYLFAGRPPASNALELIQLLREQKGIDLAAVVDGTGLHLGEMIRAATHPDVSTRTQTAEDFLAWLDLVEEEMTSPDSPPQVDPVQARRGEQLPGGYKVERVLGQGATGVALLAKIDEEEVVLKVARTHDDNQRLRDEGEVLRKLRSEYIVGLRAITEMAGRVVLVLDKAGDETLADRLRQEGRCSLELLERFGEDLLTAVAALENAGVAHRDIKPHNIAIRSGKQRLQLVLFDFSLSRAPVDNVFVGTAHYLDPFLKIRKPVQWEPSAERYATAITLYEMALGHGVFPRWGEGCDPATVADAELNLDIEAFDQEVRDGLAAFFRKALHREARSRYHNAEDMLRGWREIFREAERRTVRTSQGQEVAVTIDLDDARPDTSVEMLGLSTRARNALMRVNVTNVRELLALPPSEINFMRGVGNQTRREIMRLVGQLRERFPDMTAVVPTTPAVSEDVAVLGLSALRERLIGSPTVAPRKKGEGERRIRLALLGLQPAEAIAHHWPSQSDVATWLGLSRQRISQALITNRRRWSKDPAVTVLREEILGQLQQSGGVMAGPEVIGFLLASRGFDYTESTHAPRLASALVRIAYEAEQMLAAPRLYLTRVGDSFVLAITPNLGEYAIRLGEAADAIAGQDPLLSGTRALQQLHHVSAPELPPGCVALTSERLLRLAVAVSANAALAPRQEIYPRGMPAARALRLGLGALTGLPPGDPIKAEEVRQRIAVRFPEAEPLPGRPELDTLLASVGLDLIWDENPGVYRRPGSTLPLSSSPAERLSRQSTVSASRRVKDTPEAAEATDFEERLAHALRHGQFLVLTVNPTWLSRCEAELLSRFDLRRVSLDALFLEHLRALANEEDIDWAVVLEADTFRGSEDWQYLQILVKRAVPRMRDALLAMTEPVLLVHPGLLARYEQMTLIEQVRDEVGRPRKCPGLWLLVPGDQEQNLPLLDGQAIPILGAGQHVPVSREWLRNAHRGVAAAS